MEPAQARHGHPAIVGPDSLDDAGGSGGLLAEEDGLVDQVEDVVHFDDSLVCREPRIGLIRNGLGDVLIRN